VNVFVTKEYPLMIIAVIVLDHIVEQDVFRDKCNPSNMYGWTSDPPWTGQIYDQVLS
jgi:hypothetical protein